MKKYLIITLIISLLPLLGLKAKAQEPDELTEEELEYVCDNEIWYEEREVYDFVLNYDQNKKPEDPPLDEMELNFKESYMKYLVGEGDDRTIYNQRAIQYCVTREDRYCAYSIFPLYYFNKLTIVNYPSAALAVNNKELFEALIKEYPFLLDNAVIDYEHYHSNGYFCTPALYMIKNSQYGVLKYLIEKYDPNLLRNSGYIYRDPAKPQKQVNGLELAQQTLKWWEEKGDKYGIKCAQKTLEVVQDWYKKHAKDKKYNNKELREYNRELNRIANLDEQKAENLLPVNYEGRPLLTPDMEENYAEIQEIEKQINEVELQIMIDKIMGGFDLSAFGNKA